MKVLMSALVALVLGGAIAPAFAGNCDHSWQRASDGSQCGERAADQREGGRD